MADVREAVIDDLDIWRVAQATVDRLTRERDEARSDLAHMITIGARHSHCAECDRIRAALEDTDNEG